MQTSDWGALPDDQIRDLWNNANMIFAKIVLSLVTLQIWHIVKTGKAGQGFQVRKAPADLEKAFAVFSSLRIENFNAVELVKIQLATNQFAAHDPTFWHNEVVGKPEVANDFKQVTLQHNSKFLETFASGDFVTIRTLEDVRAWYVAKFKNKPLGQIMHIHAERKRKAAKKEIVRETPPKRRAAP